MNTWTGPQLAEGTPATHKCPGPRCGGEADVAAHMLMCSRDWYAVPKPLRRALWSTWRDGAGAGSPAHRAAMAAAIRSVARDA